MNPQDQRLRFGVLGTGAITEAVIPAIQRAPNACVSAIASRTQAKADAWRRRFEVPHAFDSYDALIESGLVDAVYIPLPNALHLPWTLRCLAAGLPVLCEKPLTLRAEDALAIARAAEASSTIVAEAFMYRFHPLMARLRELVSSGEIGRLRSMHARFSFALDDPTSIVASAELGGGALLDVGCYPVNAMRFITGAEPVRVSAFRSPAANTGDVDRTMVASVEFPGGVLGTLETSIESDEGHGLYLVGELGRLEVDDPWVAVDRESSIRVVRERELLREESFGPADCYRLEVADFADAVLSNRPPRWNLDDAVANMRALDAIAESARSGRVIVL